MILSDVDVRDWDELFARWPEAVSCPRWRLEGESPSPALFQHLVTTGMMQRAVRDSQGGLRGLLQVCDVDEVNGYGSLGFVLLLPDHEVERVVILYLHDAASELGLRKIVVSIDDDVAGSLAGVTRELHAAGRLLGHTWVSSGRCVDRHVYEFPGLSGGAPLRDDGQVTPETL